MRRKYKISLIIISVLILLISILGFLKPFTKKEEIPKNETKVISNISKYGYSLDDRDTEYMNSTFKELESILNSEEIDYNKYAEALAKLFVIDFYTLNNKVNKYDIGALEYILKDKVDSFKTKAMDTIYKDIIDNTYKDRIQNLPEITNVEIIEIKESTIDLNEEKKDCYKVTMKYTYKENLGYDLEGTIYLVKNNEKLEVAMYNPKIEE